MIEVRGISKRFDATDALSDVSFDVGEGEVVGLLGPNGSGKTTLVRILTTLLLPDRGSATVAGFDVVDDPKSLRPLIGLAGQSAAVDELLTARENLELIGLLYHLDRTEYRDRTSEILQRLSLTEAADDLVKTYSGGMRRRLDVGASLIGRPRVLFLDEPTTGLDPRTRNDLWKFVEELVAAGTTVLLTTQYMEEAERLADRLVVLDAGHVIANGTVDELEDRLGGSVLEARVADPAELDLVAEVLAAHGEGTPQIDVDERRVLVPTTGGPSTLIAAGSALEAKGIALDDLGIRRPSLDDVFLSLTGHLDGGRIRTEGPDA
jgi:daunorubicin resistance ABC transporter ATP-binding subunit